MLARGLLFLTLAFTISAAAQPQQLPKPLPPSAPQWPRPEPELPQQPKPPQTPVTPPEEPLPLPPPQPPPPERIPQDQEKALIEKFLKQGVPEHGLRKLMDFRFHHMGDEFVQDIYVCPKRPIGSTKPCSDRERVPAARKVTLVPHNYAVLIDFSLPSTTKRFFLLNLKTGAVETHFVAHGKGSGEGNYAYKFSNKKDSRQTSLGFYLAGPAYRGGYDTTMRMFGLEKSNDQAYMRDIVMHGATYAEESFIKKNNHKTGKPYGRLGLSWGCPALAPKIAKRVIPLLVDGALIYHAHPELADEALSGREVVGPNPEAEKPKP